MSGEGEGAESGAEEEEVVVDAIETPRGRVPEFDSTFKALEKITARLLEQDEKIEALAKRVASRHEPLESAELKELLLNLREEISRLESRLASMEEIIAEINERLSILEYMADIVERYVKFERD